MRKYSGKLVSDGDTKIDIPETMIRITVTIPKINIIWAKFSFFIISALSSYFHCIDVINCFFHAVKLLKILQQKQELLEMFVFKTKILNLFRCYI